MTVLMVSNRIKTFPLQYQIIISTLNTLGHEVIWAADFSGFVADKSTIPCRIEQIDIDSNPFKVTNRKAFVQICNLIKKNEISAIICSTPIGGALARLAGKKMNINPIIYTAHGFLFYKGAPMINRTVYKWEEQILARYTDVLITISREDYEEAKKLKIRSGREPYFIHGAGIKTGVTIEIDRVEKRKTIGIPEDAFLVISAGDLNKNKNTAVMVKALKYLADPTIHYIACGVGPEEKSLKSLAKQLGVEKQFHLLGYRTDIAELMSVSDAFVMMSFREGLPRSLMEAMDLGLPCIGSDTRGIRDLIDPEGGFICNPRKPEDYANAIMTLKGRNPIKMGEYNKAKVKVYSADIVRKELYEIYRETLI